MYWPAVPAADEVHISGDQPEQLIAMAGHEKADFDRVIEVGSCDRLKGYRVELIAFDERIDFRKKRKVSVPVEPRDFRGRGETYVRCLGVQRGEEVGEYRHNEQHDNQDEAKQSAEGPSQPPPHQG